MKNLEKILLAFILLVIGLHVWGAIYPAHNNYGTHFFAFYNPFIGALALVIAILVLIPPLQSRIILVLERFFQSLSKIPFLLLAGGTALFIMVVGTFFSAKLHFLGDGILLLRSLSAAEWGSNIMQSFNNQPLMYWLFRSAITFHFIDSSARTYNLYIWINRGSAFVLIIILFWCLRNIRLPLFSKIVLGVFFFFSAGSQFFFGYIENYVLQYVFTALFAIGGWLAIERRGSIIVPIVSSVLLCGLHLGNLVFLPALLVLLLLRYPQRKLIILILTSLLSIGGLAGIYVLGYLPALLKHFSPESVDFLHPFSVPSGNFGYAIFSFNHLFDWLNLNLLITPFGLILALALLVTSPGKARWKNASLLFLLSATACGLLFTGIVNTALGMARDWDLLSGFFVPLMVLDIYLLANSELVSRSRHLLVAVSVLTLLHTSAWIGVNADEGRHLARMRLLNDPRFLSPTTLLFYDEALANYFFDTGNYPDARIYYEHSISIDPNNPRIVGNISDVYRKLGEKEKYFEMLLHAVELKSVDPGIYSNLGVEYASRGDTNRAIEFNERAVALDPGQEKAHANLGLLYVSNRNFPLAKEHFIKAIELGMRDAIIYRYAAELSFFLGDYPGALKYFDFYLRVNPNDQNVLALRERAAAKMKP